MRKSIKIMAGTRIAAALLAVVLFSLLTTRNIYRMGESEEANIAVNALLQRAQKAEAAHYKWSSNFKQRALQRFGVYGQHGSDGLRAGTMALRRSGDGR